MTETTINKKSGRVRPSAPTRTEEARDDAVKGIRMQDLPNLAAQRAAAVKPSTARASAEPEGAAPVTVQRTLADDLKDAAELGLAGRVTVDPNHLALVGSQLAMISGTGPYLGPNFRASGVVISVDSTGIELYIDVTSPGVWQRGAQRFLPQASDRSASGELSIKNPACFNFLRTQIDAQQAAMPVVIVLMPPVVRDLDDETRAKLTALAAGINPSPKAFAPKVAERKVGIAVVELQEGATPTWKKGL